MKTLGIKNTVAALVIYFVGFGGQAFAQLFEQQFGTALTGFSNSSTADATYIHTSTPTNAQFTQLISSGTEVTISVASGQLTMVRGTAHYGAFSRNIAWTGPPTSLIVKMDLTVSGNSSDVTSGGGIFYIGNTNLQASAVPANGDVYSRFSINTKSTDGNFAVRSIEGGLNGSDVSGQQSIMWVMNNSGSTMYYRGPDGSNESIGNDKADIWVGTSRELNEVDVLTAAESLSCIKYVYSSATATIKIDNMLIEPVPDAPTFKNASSITKSGFTANWVTVSGSTGYRLDVSTASDFSSYVAGYENLLVNGQGSSSQAVTGLSASTTYYYRVRTEEQYTAGSVTSGNSGTSTLTTSAAPCISEGFAGGTTPPTDWTFTSIGDIYTSAGNFGASSPSLKMDASSEAVETPTVSSPNLMTVWIKGNSTDATSALLVEGFNGSWSTIENITANIPTTATTKTYNTGLGSYTKFKFTYTKSAGNLAFDDVEVTCDCAPPSSQASSVSFSNVTTSAMDINWSRGNGNGVLVLLKEAGAVDADPENATLYNSNTVLGSGDQIGTGNYAVYYGTGTSVSVSGLTPNTRYYVGIYEVNDVGACYNKSELTGNQFTLDSEPTAHSTTFSANGVSTSQIDLTFDAANTLTNGDGYIILQKVGSAPTGNPTDGTGYNVGNAIGDGTVAAIITNAASTTTSITSLNNSTQYYYLLIPFGYDGSNSQTFNYYTAATIPGANAATFSVNTDYFRSLGTGNWHTAGSWQASADNTNWATSTLVPDQNATAVTIQSGHTITINNTTTAPSLSVDGTLTFDDAAARSVTVLSGITVGASGTFITHLGGSARTHTLSMKGNIANEGVFDMSRGGTSNICNITFDNSGNQTISGGGATTRLSKATVNLGGAVSNVLEITASSFSAGASFLTGTGGALTSGTIKFSAACTTTVGNLAIGSTAQLWVNHASCVIDGTAGSYTVTGILRLTTGTLKVGTSTGNALKYVAGASIIIEGGNLNVASRLSRNGASDYCTYSQSGSSVVTLNTVENTSTSYAVLDFAHASSSFTMSGGTIVLRNETNHASGSEIAFGAITSNITGGSIQLGDGSSSLSFSRGFRTTSSVALPSITVFNKDVSSTYPQLKLLANLSILSDLTIQTNTSVDLNGFNLSLTGNFSNSGTFTSGSQSMTFSGTSAQTITGATTFYNLVLNKSSNGLTLDNDITVSNELTLTEGPLAINGNTLTLSGTIAAAGTGTITGSASSNLSITGTGALGTLNFTTGARELNNLTLNRTSTGTITLGTALQVSNVLTLTEGELILNQNTLTLANNATVAIVRTNGWVKSEGSNINSKLSWNVGSTIGTYVYPFGKDGSNYVPFSFELTAGDAGYVTVSTYGTGADNTPFPTSVSHVDKAGSLDNSASTVDRFWQIDKDGPSGTATIIVTYAASETPDTETDLELQRWNGSGWDAALAGQSNDGGANTITVPGVTSFSPWASAPAASPLPVKLVDFRAESEESFVKLSWSTYSEINNDYFTIEKSSDAHNFSPIGTVVGAGNSNEANHYVYYDRDVKEEKTYYKLKQTDYDGSFEYSNTISVVRKSSFIPSVDIYPNPVSSGEGLNLNVNNIDAEQILVVVMDVLGKEYFSKLFEFTEIKESQSFSIKTNEALSPGLYFIVGSNKNELFNKRLIVK